MTETKNMRPAEIAHPGEFVSEELEARGWSQADLAEILGRPPRLVSEIISGTRAVSPETAKGLGDAFGTGPELWMNLQGAWDLWHTEDGEEAVSRRAHLFSVAPVREMIKRGWIERSANIEVLEKQVRDFFEGDSLESPPDLDFAAKTSLPERTPNQIAWVARARRMARSIAAPNFTVSRLNRCLQELRNFMVAPEEARHVPRVLTEAGIRFVIVEPLPKTRIDGACFWIDRNAPVIALSLRYDRIDWFWFTLAHELGHVKNRDSSLDIDLAENQGTADMREQRANRFGQNFLIPDEELQDFIDRVGPLYSHKWITGFAGRLGIHPGIVVGQLQHRKEIGYSHSRKMLVKIRDSVISSALTDGWGSILPANL